MGRVIRKLFTKPEHASPLSKALNSLGFSPFLDLRFEVAPLSRNLNILAKDFELRSSIRKLLDGLVNKNIKSTDELRLAREIESQPYEELVELLAVAVEDLQLSQKADTLDLARREGYSLELALNSASTFQDNKRLKSIIVLSRVGLIRLSDCYIRTNELRVKNQFHGIGFDDKFSLTDASSGEQQLISSLFGIVAEAESGSLILIDEPELSLHPEWQTRFLDLLLGVMEPFNGCHIVIATHSALIAQRAAEFDLEILKLGEDQYLPLESSADASVDQTLLEVFDLAVRDSTYVSRLILSLVMRAEADESRKSDSKERLLELRSLYSKAEPFDKRTMGLIEDALDIFSEGNSSLAGTDSNE
ncbi:MAG: AAA family ATPase [Glaciimonas sp.]|nr:AAA family ATPase [Glaciimonas sp.]